MSLTSIATIELPATPMISHGSWGSREIGTHKSTMELFLNDARTCGHIEWDIPGLDTTEHIGVWFDGKTLRDYDGVFSIPREAIKFLRAQGYKVPREFE